MCAGVGGGGRCSGEWMCWAGVNPDHYHPGVSAHLFTYVISPALHPVNHPTHPHPHHIHPPAIINTPAIPTPPPVASRLLSIASVYIFRPIFSPLARLRRLRIDSSLFSSFYISFSPSVSPLSADFLATLLHTISPLFAV